MQPPDIKVAVQRDKPLRESLLWTFDSPFTTYVLAAIDACTAKKGNLLVSKGHSHARSLPRGLPVDGHTMLNCKALGLTLGVDEVHYIAVCLEQVNLLNAWYRVHSQPFERTLQTLVVCRGGLVHGLLLSAAAHKCLSGAHKTRKLHPVLLHASTVPSVPKDD